MTVKNISCTGALTTKVTEWDAIDWQTAKSFVYRLQVRIAKAFENKQYGKAKALQWLLTHSFYAKCLAVKRVVQNRGAKTPGVDKVIWNTPKQKIRAVNSLKRRGYKTLPLRRIYIPKKVKGELRPLSIPVMHCRAMQALYLLALEPIAEILADENSYGFRPLRSAADATSQCHSLLCRRGSAEYILEADIQSCFTEISHDWLLKHVPMDKTILANWLTAGYIEKGSLYPTLRGTPQGGIISATLLVIVLAGLESVVRTAIGNRKKNKVYFSIYADDFIVTSATRELLTERVQPLIVAFLAERGLTLSRDKTHITPITDGFDFLGINLRKYRNGKVINKPSKASIQAFLADIRQTIKSHPTAKTENLIRLLNPKIRGWTNYFRNVCAGSAFQYIAHHIFLALWQWAKRRHHNKGLRWIKRKYFRQSQTRQWIFSSRIRNKDGSLGVIDLFDAGAVKIQRHIKIRAEATAFNPKYDAYFKHRAKCKTRAA
jgi:RNA-directed DNA polymerase